MVDGWPYMNAPLNIQINKISNLFSPQTVQVEGDQKKGKILIKSTRNADEVWGPEARIEVSWEKIDPTQYHHGLKVKETIRLFGSIEVVVTKKETYWHLSHEMTYWFGNRHQMIKKRFFPSRIIHAIVFCELTQRLFEVHAVVTDTAYAKYESTILDTIFSIQCHGTS